MYHSKSQFTFVARGIDAENLGLIDPMNRRPDVLVFDDIEPEEANYSPYQMKQRLITVTDAILPMNERAHVVISGTVTMPGSIIHQLVQSILEPGDDTAEWVAEENIKVHYFAPIVDNPDGTRRSIWPEKWPLEYLESIEHTRGFAKNYANQPVATDGEYWTEEDIRYGDIEATHVIMSIDPAVTKTKKSDFYGVSVVAFSAKIRKCSVRHSRSMKLSPGALRKVVIGLLNVFPEIGLVVIETNQGGDTWIEILHGLPVRVKTIWQGEAKEARAARLLNRYQRGEVTHARKLVSAERQMCAYPKVLNDDEIDSIGTGVHFFMGLRRKRRYARTVDPK
jgi:phage terminase large subunit-like protein